MHSGSGSLSCKQGSIPSLPFAKWTETRPHPVSCPFLCSRTTISPLSILVQTHHLFVQSLLATVEYRSSNSSFFPFSLLRASSVVLYFLRVLFSTFSFYLLLSFLLSFFFFFSFFIFDLCNSTISLSHLHIYVFLINLTFRSPLCVHLFKILYGKEQTKEVADRKRKGDGNRDEKNSRERDIKRRRHGRQWQSRRGASPLIRLTSFFSFSLPFFSFFHVFLCSFSFSLMFMLFSYFSRLLRLSCVSSRFSVCIFAFSSFGKDQFSADFFKNFFFN